eukprot:gi/632970318/ref/XP_007901582.1/ PREDICTED: cat eye syndrome critical region protein 5-like [Callorhinchus milii]
MRAVRALSRALNRASLATRGCAQLAKAADSQPSFGLLIDIDGVLVRGKTPIPAARKAFRKLLDSRGELLVPLVFVTNNGSTFRQTKADQLTHILGVPISPEQVMLSHSPLRMLNQYHDKHVLVSGQGPVGDIAKSIGFSRAITVEMLREAFPLLDVVDHNRRPKIAPVRWETNLQLIVDVLLTAGNPGNAPPRPPYPHIPLLACNMDLMWMAEAKTPRFGHGTFMVCLESIYKKITGRELKYEALLGKPSETTYHYAECLLRAQAASRGWQRPLHTLYAIGDNLMTDVYGANLYNRYLREEGSRPGWRRQAKVAAGKGVRVLGPLEQHQEVDRDGDGLVPGAVLPGSARCSSVLVCTGVYSPRRSLEDSLTEAACHGHRDFTFDPALVEPDHVVPDIAAAVDLIYQLEHFTGQ